MLRTVTLQRVMVGVVTLSIGFGCGSDSTGPEDYTLSLTPALLTIAQGATATATVNVGRSNFSDAITLSLANAPAGITGVFDPASPIGGKSTLTVSVVGNADPGTYDLSVQATARPGTRSTGLTLTVNLKPAHGNATRIAAGQSHSCSLNTSSQVFCWGGVPAPVQGGVNFASISAGGHRCGVTATGDAYCWGSNLYGELGDGTTTDRLTPTPVAGGLSFASVSAGLLHTCGVTTTGAAYCWGVNQSGALGDGTTTDRIVPTPVSGGRG